MSDAGKQGLWLRQLPTNSDTQVIAPVDSFFDSLTFSPDGNYIYFRKAEDKARSFFNLFRAPVFGGTPQAVVRNLDTGITFSPDGKRIAYVRERDLDAGKYRLLVSSAEGADEKMIADGPISEVPYFVRWSPDGRQIAETIYKNGDVLTAIQLQDVLSGKSRTLAAFADWGITEALWTADGQGLIVSYFVKGLTLLQIGFVSKHDGQFHAVTKDTNSYESLTLSSDGKSLRCNSRKNDLDFAYFASYGFTGNTPDPALPQIKNPISFGWASSEELYVSDASSLVRITLDGNSKTTILNDPNAAIRE